MPSTNWCRFGLQEACPFANCDYIHLQEFLTGRYTMQSILQKDRGTLQTNWKKAVAAAKENMRSDVAKRILDVMKQNQMAVGDDEDEWDVVLTAIELVCGTLHYDLGGMDMLFRPVIQILVETLSPYVPRPEKRSSLKKNLSQQDTSSRSSGESSDCALSSAGSDSVSYDLPVYDEDPVSFEFIEVYYL